MNAEDTCERMMKRSTGYTDMLCTSTASRAMMSRGAIFAGCSIERMPFLASGLPSAVRFCSGGQMLHDAPTDA